MASYFHNTLANVNPQYIPIVHSALQKEHRRKLDSACRPE